MKAVILAGGLGTRISEESHLKPKPMITIGGKPIIWHIMKQYSHYGVNEFIICLGYKGYVVKEYFANYFLHMSDVTFDMANNEMQVHEKHVEPWKITLIETGEDTQTGGRLKKVRDYIGNETFCFTYGDGVSNINIQKLIEFHQSHGKLATVTAIQPPGRYGALNLNSERVEQFQEKPAGDGSWINGGFFVLEPEVMDFIEGPTTAWEESPLKKLADQQALMAYRHTGFWKAMDTLRDKVSLENLWQTTAPWKVWE
ncbi:MULTISPECIES: glucose-1-phosphate cytidylyltransferase [unclassified Methylophaga]|jgi:glucose-1-phosphate cytidylyltransferase|uniref:glucose-1-phosphate cytidylyltransferase n=1 Tax=unclassified Methylophaga TaxID=2629249 RepID=UPI000C673759|nr:MULTISPECIES: glucose-1-phosphate cytidylyltransferase [unclassified Methylophaga]MAL50682.1 glucose-1-phosphate cytidylyltransferase [Methylophaga sp.]MBP24023.1 glucose-1-phosphate cytidylyltransferase [Methylophaga sp.]MDX1749558.1 glucose-1-phosphate cytidylyltransferase [Methylophaga sp.]HCC81068.1 glucose-1-phosphate cytidylyltransferase [Methylophaga sp.]|tara:strand:+ start:2371 stop:3138 length:768 start_codon:yes stop_codon:yes gene_type:complete